MSLIEVTSDPNIQEYTPGELYKIVLEVWGKTPYMPPKLEVFQGYTLEEQLGALDTIALFNPGFWADSVLRRVIEINQADRSYTIANIPQARVKTPEGKVFLI